MNEWRRAVIYAFLAVVFLGVCLYFVFNYLISSVSAQFIGGSGGSEYSVSTILGGMIPSFFWTTLGFIVVSVGVGVYLGSHHIITKEPNVESLVYFFGSALLVDILLNTAFLYLVSTIPLLPGVGSSVWEDSLDGFFVGTCLLPLFCFLLAGIGPGLYIGSHVHTET